MESNPRTTETKNAGSCRNTHGAQDQHGDAPHALQHPSLLLGKKIRDPELCWVTVHTRLHFYSFDKQMFKNQGSLLFCPKLIIIVILFTFQTSEYYSQQ